MNQKIKIMNSRPDISDDEIKNYMDFERLLAKQKNIVGYRKFKIWKWSVVGFVVAFLGYWWYNTGVDVVAPKMTDTTELAKSALNESPSQESFLTDSATVNALEKEPENPIEEENFSNEKIKNKNARRSSQIIDEEEQDAVEIGKDNVTAGENVYIQAEPVDGYDVLYQYFTTQLVYPQAAIADSVQGIVTVSFIINTNGEAEHIEAGQSLGVAIQREAIRLITQMPQWKAATLNGKPVPSKVSLPLTFHLTKIKVSPSRGDTE